MNLDYATYDEGLAHTWMGGEPECVATVHITGHEDKVVAYLNVDLPWEQQNLYAKLFAVAPYLLEYVVHHMTQGDWKFTAEICRKLTKLRGKLLKLSEETESQ